MLKQLIKNLILSQRLNTKGFTLIEMMLVLLVISILVFLVIPNATAYINKANETGCQALTESYEAAKTANDNLGLNEDLSSLLARKNEICGKVH